MMQKNERFAVLDGWRGISILLVLATHFLPLGPKSWQLNMASGPLGMAIFFTLSGFLITQFLINRPNVIDFLIRRFFRIIPLAWLYLIVALSLSAAPSESWVAHLLFFANWPPEQVGGVTSHIWSLCIEVQFYVLVALMVAMLRQRGLFLLPIFCALITAYRVSNEVHAAINTYYRLDEILAGCVVALVYNGWFGEKPRRCLAEVNQLFVVVLLVVSCHPDSGFMNYFRPYLAAILVGATLENNDTRLASALDNKALFYVATISYALYVIHPLIAQTWLGSGEVLEKYLKRPLLFATVFLLAHLSTFYFESKWIVLGRSISKKLQSRGTAR